jgi:hypothetical protein
VLDLEHAEDGDDDFDEGVEVMAAEAKFVEQLQSKYSNCQLCGWSKACKIDVSGNHHPLSNNQLRGWGRSLVLFLISSSCTDFYAYIRQQGLTMLHLAPPQKTASLRCSSRGWVPPRLQLRLLQLLHFRHIWQAWAWA